VSQAFESKHFAFEIVLFFVVAFDVCL